LFSRRFSGFAVILGGPGLRAHSVAAPDSLG
jgi:hypothetical protein